MCGESRTHGSEGRGWQRCHLLTRPPDDRIVQLAAEHQRLREQIVALLARVQDLEARLAKDRHNSSKPPSSDGLKRKTKSLRQKSGKKPGGQLGHSGETLHLVAMPDDVVEHRPAVCAHCHAPLADDAPVVLRERRQVQELPLVVRLVVSEHQALHVRCPHCTYVSSGAFPPGIPSRAQYGSHVRALAVYLVEQHHLPLGRVQQLLADLFGMRLSRGTLLGWVQQAAHVLVPVEQHIKAALVRSPVLHHDETGVRRAGTLAWAHVTSTSRLTHYAIHPKRGHEAMDAIGILPVYHGVSMHDGWDSYVLYTTCRHALCNVHHLRELTFLEEQYAQAWASDLKALLREMKTATDLARTTGRPQLAPALHADFLDRYQALLKAGLAANPPPPDQERRPGQRGRLKQTPARNLLERLRHAARRGAGHLGLPRRSGDSLRQQVRRSVICATSRCNKRSPAVSAASGERRRTRRSAAIWRPYASRATRSWPPFTPALPASPSIQPLPGLVVRQFILAERRHMRKISEKLPGQRCEHA